MKTRYKITVSIDGFVQNFKRYGETVDEVKSELEQFIKEAYAANKIEIIEAQPDKTHPTEPQEDLSEKSQENVDANSDETRG